MINRKNTILFVCLFLASSASAQERKELVLPPFPEMPKEIPLSPEEREAQVKKMQTMVACEKGDDSILDTQTAKKLKANREEAVEAVKIVYKEHDASTLLIFAHNVENKLRIERAYACGEAVGMNPPNFIPLPK